LPLLLFAYLYVFELLRDEFIETVPEKSDDDSLREGFRLNRLVILDRARLSVRQALVLAGNEPALQEPKTAKGRRSIPLPPETVAALRAHKTAKRKSVSL
jgi:hypothetical protein